MVVAGGDDDPAAPRGCRRRTPRRWPRNSWSSASKTSSSSSTLGRDRLDPGEPGERAHPQRVGVDRAVEGVVELHALGDEGACWRAHLPPATAPLAPRASPRSRARSEATESPAACREQRADAAAHQGPRPRRGARTEATTRSRVVLPAPVGPIRAARPNPGSTSEVYAAAGPTRRGADAAETGTTQGSPHARGGRSRSERRRPSSRCLAAGQGFVSRASAVALTRSPEKLREAATARGL